MALDVLVGIFFHFGRSQATCFLLLPFLARLITSTYPLCTRHTALIIPAASQQNVSDIRHMPGVLGKKFPIFDVYSFYRQSSTYSVKTGFSK